MQFQMTVMSLPSPTGTQMARIATNRKVCDELLTGKQVQLRGAKVDASDRRHPLAMR